MSLALIPEERWKKETFIRELWRLALGRLPSPEQLKILTDRLEEGADPLAWAIELASCPEAQTYSLKRKELERFSSQAGSGQG